MWLLRFRWPITIGLRLGEGTRSRSPLTEGPRECYVQILEEEPLIRNKCGNWGGRTIFRSAAESIRGSKSSGQLVLGPKRPSFGRSRNNSRLSGIRCSVRSSDRVHNLDYGTLARGLSHEACGMVLLFRCPLCLSLIHISEPTRPTATSRMPSSA